MGKKLFWCTWLLHHLIFNEPKIKLPHKGSVGHTRGHKVWITACRVALFQHTVPMEALFLCCAFWLILELFCMDMGDRKLHGMLRLKEQRVNIKFLCASGRTPIQCWESLRDVYGQDAASKSTVRYWHRRFWGGDTDVADKPRNGRPSSVRTPDAVDQVRNIVDCDRRRTVRSIAAEVGINRSTTHKIIKKNLKMSKVCAKFVPRILTPELKHARIQMCEMNLQMLRDDPYLIDKIVSGDKSWFAVFDPEKKSASAQWKTPEERRPQKALRSRSVRKTMLTCFYDSSGTILTHFLPMGETTDTDMYLHILGLLKERIRRKRPHLWKKPDKDANRPFYLLHDNASSHTATLTLALLGESGIQMINHPPYSPNLAPCDFCLFPTLKNILWGVHHRTVQDLQANIVRQLRLLKAEQYSKSLEELPVRWQKCIAAGGDYFEGMHMPVEYDVVQMEDSEEEAESDWTPSNLLRMSHIDCFCLASFLAVAYFSIEFLTTLHSMFTVHLLTFLLWTCFSWCWKFFRAIATRLHILWREKLNLNWHTS